MTSPSTRGQRAPRRWWMCGVVALAVLALSGCGAFGSENASAEEQFGDLVDISPDGSADASADGETPEVLPLEEFDDATDSDAVASQTQAPQDEAIGEDAPAVSGEAQPPRVTDEGIRVGPVADVVDLGNGPEQVMMIAASSGAGEVAIIFDDELVANTATIDYDVWAISGDVLTIRVETSPQVTEVRVTTTAGGADVVAPDADGFAVLGARAAFGSEFLVEGFDASGTLVGTCNYDGSSLECTD